MKSLKQHESICSHKRACIYCGEFFQKDVAKEHLKTCRHKHPISNPNSNSQNDSGFTCRKCNTVCENRSQLYIHQGLQHGGSNELQEFSHTLDGETAQFRKVYEANKQHILARPKKLKYVSTYNFPVDGIPESTDVFEEQLKEIESNEDEAFKLNLALGIMLKKGNSVSVHGCVRLQPEATIT